ncbi:hypothetical protein HPB47_014157 [Ixodes persulcatus]|uniref:Uncharacterized protein n=1 Tax=Ixodes persulcatus TaxID=34615 RepID=A0AC60QZ96_IXOPE|nr:hypothetical protein HPB47_014157 [Ixodes persulcatus]
MIILLWTLRSKKPQAAVLSWCTADGCLEHAAVLTKSMDRSVQPCEDFYAYVCGNWKHGSLGIINISDAAGIVRARFQQANALMLFNGTSSLASFNRVAATFKSCIKRGNEDLPSNLRKLKSFMKARGIPWPYEAQGDRHPLDVLLDLDINWGLPVLFETRLFKDSPKISVVMRSNRLTDIILGEENLQGFFDKEIIRNRMIVFRPIYHHGEQNMKMLEPVQDTYEYIIKTLKIAVVNSRGFTRMTIDALQGTTSQTNSSKNTWLGLLNKYFRNDNHTTLTGSTEVVTNNAELLKAVNDLTKTLQWKHILNVIGFWFVEFYTNVAEDSLLAITFYNSAMKLLPMVCYYQIEQRYGAAMLTGYVDDRFPKSSQDLVTRLLTNIKQYVISKLGQKNSGAADRVRQLNFRLWPSKSLESSLNKAFPNQWSLYIDFWNQTLGTKGRLLGLPEYDDLYDLPGLFDPIVDYMPLGNKLSISLSALSSPFYYREGTMAINYGGLGWQVARTAFRAARGTAQRRSPRNKDKALASRDSKEMWYLTGIDIISLYQYYLSIYSLHVLELAALPFFSLDRSHFAKRGESFDNSSIL